MSIVLCVLDLLFWHVWLFIILYWILACFGLYLKVTEYLCTTTLLYDYYKGDWNLLWYGDQTIHYTLDVSTLWPPEHQTLGISLSFWVWWWSCTRNECKYVCMWGWDIEGHHDDYTWVVAAPWSGDLPDFCFFNVFPSLHVSWFLRWQQKSHITFTLS